MDAASRDPERAVIFLHIGKTAGTTLGRILRRHYPADKTYSFPVPSDAREVEFERQSGDAAQRRLHPPREASLKTFAELPLEQRARYQLLVGHTVFGIHLSLPQSARYTTMLRHPTSLVPSLYAYIRRTPGHFLHSAVRDMSLVEFVESGVSLETDNSQTRAISGDLYTKVGECSPEMLKTAQRNLDEWFPVVGITSRFDESLIALRQEFGYTRLHYVRAKTAPRGQRSTTLDPAVHRLIEEQNALDVALYERASATLDRQVGGAAGRVAVARLARHNRLYRPIGAATYTLPKAIVGRVRSARPG